MKEFTKEQLNEAKKIIEYLNESFMEDGGIIDVEFEDAVKEYRKEHTRENYIKALCSFCLHDVYLPYKLEVIDGEKVWGMETITNTLGETAQYMASSPERISKYDAMRCSWHRDDGVRFFLRDNGKIVADFIIVNHEVDFFQFYAEDIKTVCVYLQKIIDEDYEYTQEDVFDFAEILLEERIFLDSKKYRCKSNGETYKGFYYLTNDDQLNNYFYIIDEKKGLIKLSREEYRAMEEIA